MQLSTRDQQTQGHLIEWSQTDDDAVIEIGDMYGLEQKEYESIDEYRERIMHIALTQSDEEYQAEIEELHYNNDIEQLLKEEYEREEAYKQDSTMQYRSPETNGTTWASPYNSQYYRPPANTPKKIIGIDPGITNLGWAILEYEKVKWEYKYIKSGSISTATLETEGAKYTRISDLIYELILKESPIKQIAIEDLFFHKNVKTANKTAGAIAIVKMVAHHAGLEPIMVSPPNVKKAATGSGKADKKMVLESINKSIELDIKVSHEADAVAIAMAAIFNEHKEVVKAEKQRSQQNDANAHNTKTNASTSGLTNKTDQATKNKNSNETDRKDETNNQPKANEKA